MPTMAPEQHQQQEQVTQEEAVAAQWRAFTVAQEEWQPTMLERALNSVGVVISMAFSMPKPFEPQNTHFNDRYTQQDIRMTPRFLDEHVR